MENIGTVKTWTYKGRSAQMLVTEANWGIAEHMTAKSAIEHAYGVDVVSEQVMRGRHGLRPVA